VRARNDTESSRDDEAWHRFLALLAPDREGAAALYRELRRRLVDLFRWRGLAAADDLADEALERAVKHVAAGDEIRSVTGYVCGIANRLALEAARREAKVAPLEDERVAHAVDDDAGERLDSLDRCLERLPRGTRELVLRYYAVGPERIADRKLIAEELGIGLNALRIRIHRLRVALETCLAGAEAS
jgi:DNA-directed RNA polymerase specialized sigma24 family protein